MTTTLPYASQLSIWESINSLWKGSSPEPAMVGVSEEATD